VSCTTADSYLEASREAGAVAELAAYNKMVKYAGPSSQGEFVQIAVEFHGPVNGEAFQFLSELAVGDWRRRPGCSSIFVFVPTDLQCNHLIGFCCTMALLMKTCQGMVHYHTNVVIYFCNF